jgi:integrase
LRSIAQQAHGGADAQPIPDPHKDPGVIYRTWMTAMPTIEKRATPACQTRYRARVRVKGTRTVSATFNTRSKAERWAHRTELEIRDGKYFKTAESRSRTVADLIDRYLSEVLPLKPKSALQQRPQLDWWREQLGHRILGDVTTTHITECRQALLSRPGRNNRRRGHATANRYLAVLSHAFNIAVREWEWLQVSPVARIRKFKESSGRTTWLDREQLGRLLAACRSSDYPWLELFVALAASTGMRHSEILTLRRNQIDIDAQHIFLGETKNGEHRVVPLAGKALLLVKARTASLPNDSALLFPGKKPDRPICIWKYFDTARRSAGFPSLRIHDLRHTAGTHLIMNGASDIETAAVLGHKTLAMTKRYVHPPASHIAQVVSRMNRDLLGSD